MGYVALELEEIHSKNDICIYRVFVDKETYIIKYFSNKKRKKEILNYEIL